MFRRGLRGFGRLLGHRDGGKKHDGKQSYY